MKLKEFSSADIAGKKVLVRVDYNVPISDGVVTDITRLHAHLPTLNALKENGAKITLISHLGRPKGTVNLKYTLKPVAEKLAEMTGWNVRFVPDCIGEEVKKAVESQTSDEVLVLENLRFYKEEEKNDSEFARKLAENFEVFVMDAFSVSHRAHASTRAIADDLPSFAGKQIGQEIKMLSEARDTPENPFILIMGGSKVSDKISVIENMLPKISTIIIGGGMAFTFEKARGNEIGKSLCEDDKVEFASAMIAKAKELGVKMLLPVDYTVADEMKADAASQVVAFDKIPADMMGLDIGPETAKIFGEEMKTGKTIVWNGPMGVFEMPRFEDGTKKIAEALVEATKLGAFTVVGGGDSAAAMAQFGLQAGVSHVSTGGGASLDFFSGAVLPGVEPYIVD